MRKLIVTLVALIAVVLAVGIYLEWFNFSRKPDTQDDKKVVFNMEVDKEKIKKDLQNVSAELGKRSRAGMRIGWRCTP